MAEIYVGNRDSNFQMVQFGAAYAYRQYLKQCDRDSYLRAEAIATKKGLGVWGPGGLTSQLRCLGNSVVHVVVETLLIFMPKSIYAYIQCYWYSLDFFAYKAQSSLSLFVVVRIILKS